MNTWESMEVPELNGASLRVWKGGGSTRDIGLKRTEDPTRFTTRPERLAGQNHARWAKIQELAPRERLICQWKK